MFKSPRVNPFINTPSLGFKAGVSFPGSIRGVDFSGDAQKASFKDVMGNMIQDLDKTLVTPDNMMKRALSHGDVDIHEVMIANSKADIAVNIASQVVTKVIQAYERVQQIQV